MAQSPSKRPKEDRWIPSACSMSYSMCSIKGHVVDGTLVKIEGNPDSPVGSGRLCAKGTSGMMMLYDPNRIDKPLKRTNPEKGIGVDPKWVEISWDEALDIVVEKLKECHEYDPRALMLQGTTTCAFTALWGLFVLGQAFGTANMFVAGGGLHCGNGSHELGGLMHASWSIVPDWKYTNYALYFGCSKGHSAGHVANQNAQDAADARARGMKMVVVDPLCSFPGGKAAEWVPIRVGTDAALALSMCNLLVNEYGMYDKEYLTRCTNGPYLIKEDGHYLRDEKTKKPMVWDAVAGCAKTFDDETIGKMALEGSYTANGQKVNTGFQLFKEHVKRYTPDYAEKITSVPATAVRRLAKEFGENARIGSTIVIDGVEVPYRPSAAIFFRGIQGHVNSTFNCLAVDLLNQLVGSADACGGALGFNPVCHGHPETGRPAYVPTPDPDGMMITGSWLVPHRPYPLHDAAPASSLSLGEVFPTAMMSPFLVSEDREQWWDKFKLPYRPKVLLNYGANSVMSVGNKECVVDSLKKMDFVISFDILLNETTDFADVVLPDTSYMERMEPNANYPFIFNHPPGLGTWGYAIRQPLVEPVGERRNFLEVVYEILDRLDLREPGNIATNVYHNLHGDYKLKPSQRYTYEEISDRVLKDRFGDGRGLEWFKENGVLTWQKNPKEVYWRYSTPVRVPIYFEHFKVAGEQIRKIAREHGAEDDVHYFAWEPLPDYNPCPSHVEKDPSFDLYSFYFRDSLHTNSLTMENPWLDEASRMNWYSYTITMHKDVGKKKGIKEGDVIWVESPYGRKVKGKVHLAEGIHPEHIAMGALCGHWSKNQPIALGKGVFYNELLEVNYDHMDPNNHSLDLCVKVKVYKA